MQPTPIGLFNVVLMCCVVFQSQIVHYVTRLTCIRLATTIDKHQFETDAFQPGDA